MLEDLAGKRAEARLRQEALDVKAKEGWRKARRNFKILLAPVVLGVAYVIWLCGYFTGLMVR